MKILQRMIAPLDPAEFLETIFEKKALHLPGSAGKFDFFFPAGAFRDNLDRVGNIRAVFSGFRQINIGPGDIPDMAEAGATICLTGLEDAHPDLKAHLRSLRRETGYPGEITVRAYLSPPGKGFDPHYDARTVTTLQLQGEKAWKIGRLPVVPYPAANATADVATRPGDRDAVDEIILRPGDLLSLPAGTVHSARALSWCLALNVAFEYIGVRFVDLIERQLRKLSYAETVMREPLPRMHVADPDALPGEALQAVRQRVLLLKGLVDQLANDDRWIAAAWRELLPDSTD